MTNFTMYVTVYDSLYMSHSGKYQLSTGDAALFSMVALYSNQTALAAKNYVNQSNSCPIEYLSLNFDALVLWTILSLLVLTVWRLNLKRSGITVPKSPAYNSSQASDSMSVVEERGYYDLGFDVSHAGVLV